MDNYLNWTFDYRRHQNPGCDFYQKLTGLLEQAQYGEDNSYCYFLLPNFHFNHQCPGIERQEELVVGELSLQKKADQGKWIYDIRRKDSTSGEEIELRTVIIDDIYMSLTDHQVLRCCINGKTLTVHQECVPKNECTLTSIFAIPALIRKCDGKTADFSFMDRHGQIFTAQKIRKIGSDKLKIKEKTITLTGYCLLGHANPPSYWWMDTYGHLLIVSTPLLTYVAGPHRNKMTAGRGHYES